MRWILLLLILLTIPTLVGADRLGSLRSDANVLTVPNGITWPANGTGCLYNDGSGNLSWTTCGGVSSPVILMEDATNMLLENGTKILLE